MIALRSPFILKNFLLLKQNIDLVLTPNDKRLNILEIIDLYNIDIDFAVEDTQKPFYQIFVKIGVNMSEPKQFGYSIFAEGVGIFEFDESRVKNEKEKGNFIYFSGISICVNSLRSIIANVTSHCPYGKYSLPSIDVNNLLKDKGVLKQKPESK